MNKQDWLTYFETVNGRPATEEEITQALANGEFQDVDANSANNGFNQPFESSAVKSELEQNVQSQTVQEPFAQANQEGAQYTAAGQGQEQYNQGYVDPNQAQGQYNQAYVDPNQTQDQYNQGYVDPNQAQGQYNQAYADPNQAQGQYNQGYVDPNQVQDQYNQAYVDPNQQTAFGGQQVYSPQAPKQANKVGVFFKDLWTWLLSAWKSPANDVTSHTSTPYIVLGTIAFLFSITIYTVIYRIAGGGFSGYGVGSPFGFNAYLLILILSVLYIISLLASAFLAKRFIYKDTEFTYSKCIDWFARVFSFNLIILLLAFLFALVGVIQIASLIFYLSIILFGAGFSFTIIDTNESKTGLSRYNKYLISLGISLLILFVWGLISSSVLSSYIQSYFNSLFSW